jgi:hypothetical protein
MSAGFHNLDNREIVFIYLSNLRTLNSIKEMLERKEIESSMPFMGSEISFRLALTEESIDKIVTHDYYKCLESVNSKLKVIVDLIRDVDPELYEDVKDKIDISIGDIL